MILFKEIPDLNLDEAVVLYLIDNDIDIIKVVNNLINKNLAQKDIFTKNITTTPQGRILLEKSMSKKIFGLVDNNDTDLENLAKKLKEIFPKGKKTGTPYNWSDGIKVIKLRLAMFYKRFGEYSDEAIIKAAQDYVSSFKGDYTYMQLLKYFIYKDKVNSARSIEVESPLLSFIENPIIGEEDREDWTTNII